MGKITKPNSVKLIIGFIFKDHKILSRVKAKLSRIFGKVDFESPILDFYHTNYYEKEIGRDLKRQFISFNRLISPEKLAKIKVITNSIEDKFLAGHNRKINIDPGYLDFAKLVLASTKDYVHRIYLGKGIFAEITLHYQGKSYCPWSWTYPDYQSQQYLEIFNQIRRIYAQQI